MPQWLLLDNFDVQTISVQSSTEELREWEAKQYVQFCGEKRWVDLKRTGWFEASTYLCCKTFQVSVLVLLCCSLCACLVLTGAGQHGWTRQELRLLCSHVSPLSCQKSVPVGDGQSSHSICSWQQQGHEGEKIPSLNYKITKFYEFLSNEKLYTFCQMLSMKNS